MAKRYHDTDIWKQDWYIEMPNEYRLLYLWIKDNCDFAGIWKPDIKFFELLISGQVDLNLSLKYFNKDKERIVVTQLNHWFVVDFFSFQYGSIVNENNRVHEAIFKIYEKEGIILRSIRGLIEVKVKSNSGLIEVKDSPIYIQYSIIDSIDKGKKDKSKKSLISLDEPKHKLQTFIKENYSNISKLKNQLTFDECEKLKKDYPTKMIMATLESMENKVDLTKKYKSVYLTLKTWLKRSDKTAEQYKKEEIIENKPKEAVIDQNDFFHTHIDPLKYGKDYRDF